MTRAIIFPFTCTDTTLPLQDMTEPPAPITPIAGATRDYVAAPLALGALTSVPSLVGGAPALSGTASVVDDGVVRALQFNGTSDFLTDNTLTRTQPYTLFVRFRLLALATAKFIVGSSGSSGVSFATNSSNNVQVNAGSNLVASPAVYDLLWHTAVIVVNGASSVLSIDGVDTAGNVGANAGAGFRLGAGPNTPSSFTNMLIARAGYVPHAADATERAAIRSALS